MSCHIDEANRYAQQASARILLFQSISGSGWMAFRTRLAPTLVSIILLLHKADRKAADLPYGIIGLRPPVIGPCLHL